MAYLSKWQPSHHQEGKKVCKHPDTGSLGSWPESRDQFLLGPGGELD